MKMIFQTVEEDEIILRQCRWRGIRLETWGIMGFNLLQGSLWGHVHLVLWYTCLCFLDEALSTSNWESFQTSFLCPFFFFFFFPLNWKHWEVSDQHNNKNIDVMVKWNPVLPGFVSWVMAQNTFQSSAVKSFQYCSPHRPLESNIVMKWGLVGPC